jgi:hypothetical protein
MVEKSKTDIFILFMYCKKETSKTINSTSYQNFKDLEFRP